MRVRDESGPHGASPSSNFQSSSLLISIQDGRKDPRQAQLLAGQELRDSSDLSQRPYPSFPGLQSKSDILRYSHVLGQMFSLLSWAKPKGHFSTGSLSFRLVCFMSSSIFKCLCLRGPRLQLPCLVICLCSFRRIFYLQLLTVVVPQYPGGLVSEICEDPKIFRCSSALDKTV